LNGTSGEEFKLYPSSAAFKDKKSSWIHTVSPQNLMQVFYENGGGKEELLQYMMPAYQNFT